MNTQENNKLIAEFMEYPDLGTKGDFSYLKYHTSWDWLMPVVEKILKKEGGPQYICISANDSIHQLYKAVVEFIKQYNK
jgi:hypothetical protein